MAARQPMVEFIRPVRRGGHRSFRIVVLGEPVQPVEVEAIAARRRPTRKDRAMASENAR